MLMFYACSIYIVFDESCVSSVFICIHVKRMWDFHSDFVFGATPFFLFFWLLFLHVWEFRYWGIIALVIAYIWQLYTMWILIRLHESNPGLRYNRYVQLAQAAFGNHPVSSPKGKISSVDEQQINHCVFAYSFMIDNFLFLLSYIVAHYHVKASRSLIISTCSFFSLDETNISFLAVNLLFGLMGIVSFVNTFQVTHYVV